jgi:deoxyribodipyrimidine photolyase-related protein
MASKPYVASGKYIQRMSNYCSSCSFDPSLSTGPRACPFTTLYWDFLLRHQSRFAKHPRTALMWRNAERLTQAQRAEIQAQANKLRLEVAAGAADPNHPPSERN